MTIGLPRSGLLLLILACTVRAALAQAPAAPLQYADDFAELGQSVAASGLPIMLVFTRPGCPFCARAKQDHLEPLNASPGYGAKVVMREIEAPNALIPLRDTHPGLDVSRLAVAIRVGSMLLLMFRQSVFPPAVSSM